jgi:tetratricopeptide (TPR) repeat protein
MKTKRFFSALFALPLAALLAASALGQVGRIEGDVKKKGTGEPIVDAQVEIVRQDIKGSYPVKTDKKGHFIHAGVPFQGKYTLLVSAAGYAPDARTDVRPTGELLTFELMAGDGRKLTMEEVMKGSSSSAAGAAPSAKSAAEAKKQQEEYEKKVKEVQEKNAKMQADHETMKKHFETGRQLASNKDYSGAINAFNEAVKLDAEQHVIHANLALALYNRAVGHINAKATDQAKTDLTDSVKASTKALEVYDASVSKDPAKANDPATKKGRADYLRFKADAEWLLATRAGAPDQAAAAVADYKTLVEMLDDPAEKSKYRVKAARTLFDAGKTPEAIAAFQEVLSTEPDNLDALYYVGLAYAGEEKTFQESANMLQRFVEKAPATDSRVAEAQASIQYLRDTGKVTPQKGKAATPARRKS